MAANNKEMIGLTEKISVKSRHAIAVVHIVLY